MNTLINIDAGGGIGGAEAPAVVAIGGFQAEDVCPGMSVACAEAAGLDFGGARSVDVEARSELAVYRVADFKAIEQVLGFSGAGAGNVKVVEIVLCDFGHGGEALC